MRHPKKKKRDAHQNQHQNRVYKRQRRTNTKANPPDALRGTQRRRAPIGWSKNLIGAGDRGVPGRAGRHHVPRTFTAMYDGWARNIQRENSRPGSPWSRTPRVPGGKCPKQTGESPVPRNPGPKQKIQIEYRGVLSQAHNECPYGGTTSRTGGPPV